ncbi:MAG: restriction endonuclease subunit S, partial [Bacteroidales bacterium]|nr:restriction endonuclease subunit S [Bacteroidales bacterium]
FVDYGTRVVRKKDGGTIYPVYGGGGATFQMDIYNRENCLVVARFAMSQTCTRFVQGKFFLNDSGLTLRAKDKDLSQQFLDWIIISKNDLIYSFGKGSAQKNLDMEDFRNMEISFPVSLPEQQRIVDILDREFAKIDALKANAEKSLQAAKDLFQATLKKELEPKDGWKKKRLDEICRITAELIDPTLPEYLNQTHIGGANIVAETGILIDLKTSKEENLISGKFPFDETMVLYSKIRPYLKKVCCPDFKGICSADIYPLKPNPGYDRTFLYYILLSNDFTDYAILGSARAGMPKVNRPYMFAYSCFVPEYDEQQTIANRLNAVREQTYALQENYQKTLTLCDDLKLSLLRKAFNGEL